MANAVADYQREQAKVSGERRSLRDVAAAHDVNYRTLGRLAAGGVSMSAFNAQKQKLSMDEERVLVDWALEESDRGFPPSLRDIEKVANAILETRKGPQYKPVGNNWVDRFLERHREELQTHWSKPLDTACARALNPAIVEHWFNKVVRCQGTKTQHKQGAANQENVTALVTICADGTVLKPTIIFKGKNFMKNWRDNNVAQASFAHSPNGWTNEELALSWMIDDFDAQTKDKAAGEPRALFMDRHSSHYTPELLRYAQERNIIILGYPLHCTHALQGLDVVCFARMKLAWAEEVEKFETEHDHGVNKGDFAGVFGTAFLKAFTEDTVRAAFRATGLVLFDPTVITHMQMKPSMPTSVKGAFPLALPSPVRAVMATFHHQPPTAFDVDENTHLAASPSRHPSTSISSPRSPLGNHNPNLDPALFTPSKRPHTRDPATDPDLYTPSKRIRLLSSSLASTSSGSFLLSKVPITSEHPITRLVFEAVPPLGEPDWNLTDVSMMVGAYQSRALLEQRNSQLTSALKLARQHIDARNRILEGAHAQMVVQNVYLDKLNVSLKGKETKLAKKTDQTKLFPDGKGRHLTDEGFIAALENSKVVRAEEEAAKRQRKSNRAEKKAEKEAIEAQWKEMLAAHKMAVERWEVERERQAKSGVLKKHLPAKPKRPTKPKPTGSTAIEDESCGEEASEDDDSLP